MKPLGQKPVRFPCKIDVHPKKGYVNWWEATGGNDENKTAARREGKEEVLQEFEDSLKENKIGN